MQNRHSTFWVASGANAVLSCLLRHPSARPRVGIGAVYLTSCEERFSLKGTCPVLMEISSMLAFLIPGGNRGCVLAGVRCAWYVVAVEEKDLVCSSSLLCRRVLNCPRRRQAAGSSQGMTLHVSFRKDACIQGSNCFPYSRSSRDHVAPVPGEGGV